MHIAGEREVGVGAASLEKAAAWLSGRSLEAAQMGLHKAFVKGAQMMTLGLRGEPQGAVGALRMSV